MLLAFAGITYLTWESVDNMTGKQQQNKVKLLQKQILIQNLKAIKSIEENGCISCHGDQLEGEQQHQL